MPQLHNPHPLLFRGAIFDLDGVVTTTAKFHFQAWKKMFEDDAGIKEFTHDDYLRYVDGKPRIDGIRALFVAKRESINNKELNRLAAVKQDYFLEFVKAKGVEVFDDARWLIRKFREQDVRLALVSSSKNAPFILKKAGIYELFDVVVAGDSVIGNGRQRQVSIRGKPAPDIFQVACRELRLVPHEVVGFEDAVSGIEALKTANIKSIGINRGGNNVLRTAGADIIVRDFHELTPEMLNEFFLKRKPHKV